jgi:hypothetical protein
MKRIIITGAALLAVIPASLGLIGNASFAQSVPVRVPSQATPVGSQTKHIDPGDDKGGLAVHVEPGDDKGGSSSALIEATDKKVSSGDPGKVDDAGKVDVKGGTDDGAGHK